MKKTIPTKQVAVVVAIFLLSILFYGRTRLVSSEPPPTPIPRAPSGMVLLKDVQAVTAGTKVYTQNGQYVGTVRTYEASHDFASAGGVQPGFLLVHEPGTTPMWLTETIVRNTYYARK